MKAAGFGQLCFVPFVMTDDWVYHAEASRYLLDRAAGLASERPELHRRRPTPISMKSFGRAIANFLEWCESQKSDWRLLRYENDILDGYQRDMQWGTWSASGSELSPGTINLRVGEVCSFLSWAARTGLRPAFPVPMQVRKVKFSNARNAWGHQAREKLVRLGRVRPNPAVLRMPTDAELQRWRKCFESRWGETKALMADLILQTGIRRAECASWRLDTLPLNRADWLARGGSVMVTIRFGTKGGPKVHHSDGSMSGPARTIEVPMLLAERIHAYRGFRRKRNRAILIRAKRSKIGSGAELAHNEAHLFLSDSTGGSVSAESLYEAWTSSSSVPFPGWSPHAGRHWWACKTLLNALRNEMRALPSANIQESIGWLRGAATDALLLKVKPQLGHIDESTSQRYIGWVTQCFEKGVLDIQYETALEETGL